MAHRVRARGTSRRMQSLLLIAILGTAAQLVLSIENRGVQGRAPQRNLIGKERLISVEPLPEAGVMCENTEESNPKLIAGLQQSQSASALFASLPRRQYSEANTTAPSRPSDAVRSAVAKRMPATTIKDPRNTFSGLFVDPARNEVVIAEENNYSLLVYDRLENTAPSAAFSEPKRMIAGENTFLEYACSVYVDPPTGDIYAINNDTLTWMTVFDHNAKGDASPIRKVETPQSSYAIVADEETQEILMTIQDEHAVVTYKKSAKSQDAPVRLLQGPHTKMADPHGIALDTKTGLIYVVNWGTGNNRRYDLPNPDNRGARKPNWPMGRENGIPGTGYFDPPSITVHRKDAKGDTPPVRVIQGPKTMMNWPTSIAVHPDRGEIFVANDTADTVTVYRAEASGDVAPIRVLKGPKSMIKNPTGVALDLKNNELWVANFGNHSATVYPVDANGDATPKRIIRSAPVGAGSPMLSNPHTIAYDSKRDELLVAN